MKVALSAAKAFYRWSGSRSQGSRSYLMIPATPFLSLPSPFLALLSQLKIEISITAAAEAVSLSRGLPPSLSLRALQHFSFPVRFPLPPSLHSLCRRQQFLSGLKESHSCTGCRFVSSDIASLWGMTFAGGSHDTHIRSHQPSHERCHIHRRGLCEGGESRAAALCQLLSRRRRRRLPSLCRL